MYDLHFEYEINLYPEIQLLIESQSYLKIQEEVLDRGVRQCCQSRRRKPRRRGFILRKFLYHGILDCILTNYLTNYLDDYITNILQQDES